MGAPPVNTVSVEQRSQRPPVSLLSPFPGDALVAMMVAAIGNDNVVNMDSVEEVHQLLRAQLLGHPSMAGAVFEDGNSNDDNNSNSNENNNEAPPGIRFAGAVRLVRLRPRPNAEIPSFPSNRPHQPSGSGSSDNETNTEH